MSDLFCQLFKKQKGIWQPPASFEEEMTPEISAAIDQLKAAFAKQRDVDQAALDAAINAAKQAHTENLQAISAAAAALTEAHTTQMQTLAAQLGNPQ